VPPSDVRCAGCERVIVYPNRAFEIRVKRGMETWRGRFHPSCVAGFIAWCPMLALTPNRS
jgi:hypothetical protein